MSKQFPTVRMTHPKVKSEGHVPESAVPLWEDAGWKRVEPVKAPEADKPAVKAAAKNEKEAS